MLRGSRKARRVRGTSSDRCRADGVRACRGAPAWRLARDRRRAGDRSRPPRLLACSRGSLRGQNRSPSAETPRLFSWSCPSLRRARSASRACFCRVRQQAPRLPWGRRIMRRSHRPLDLSVEETMRVGFIGLGNMGEPLAGFVRTAGHSLVVHDLRKAAAATLLESGATWAESARDVAAQSDVICICVQGPPEMRQVALGAGGIREGVKAGSVVLDLTTNAPGVVREVGEALKARGAHLLDAPLDGGREGALAGQVTLFVGGDEAVLSRVKPVLDTFSKSVVWVGELGTGSITKIVHNALAMSIDLLLAECLTLGAKAGVAVPRLIEAFNQGCIVSQNMTYTK